MFPRPRGPYQGGMNPYRMNPMMSRGNYPPMQRMQMGMRPGRGQRGGGLLARLLGGSNQRSGMNFMSGAGRAMGSTGNMAGGSILKSITNPNAISGFLSNTQKVLNTAGQIGPIVQQYGPLVRNLPAMWKLYRGLKDLPSTTDEETEKEENSENPLNSTIKESTTIENSDSDAQVKRPKQQKTSVPKLYI